MKHRYSKDLFGVHEHDPLVSLYLKGGTDDCPFWEDPESDHICTIHRDYLPSLVAKLKEYLEER